MTDPKVSVVVPAYNAQDTIDECLRSLCAVEYATDDLEIIVVDNASTDDTAGVVTRHDGRVRTVREPRRGPAAARNAGLRAARHEVVAMTDADCVVDAGWLRHLVAPLRDPGVAIVGGRILARRPCNAVEEFGEWIHDHEAAITAYRPPHVITMNWASRRSLVEALGWFDESFLRAEDVDFSYRVAEAGHRFAYAPEAVVYHRNERTMARLFREGFVHGRHAGQVLRKHRAYLESLGHGRATRRAWRPISAALRDYLRERDQRALFRAVFSSGKELGRLTGWRRGR